MSRDLNGDGLYDRPERIILWAFAGLILWAVIGLAIWWAVSRW